MKKMKTKISLTGVFMLIACALFGVVDSTSVMAATVIPNNGGGALAAGATTIEGKGVTITGESLRTDITRANSDIILDPVDRIVTKMRPSATPLDQIMRYTKAKSTTNMQFKWYSIDISPVSNTITASADPAGGADANRGTITVANGAMFNISDTLRVVHAAGGDDTFLYVESVNANVLTCIVPYDSQNETRPLFNAARNVNGDMVYILGRAAAEGEVRTTSASFLPDNEGNYCQIFKMEVGESTIQKMANKEVDWSLTDIEEQAMYEFRMRMEASYLFGKKGYFYDNTKHLNVYTTEGLIPYILRKGSTHELQGNAQNVVTNDELIDLTREIFTKNSGDRKRVLLGGSGFMSVLSKVQTVEKQIEAGNTKVVWGIEWNEIRTNFGTLLCSQHDLFDLYGFTNKAIVIDPQYLEKWTLKSLTRDNIDLKSSGIFDGDVAVSTEISGLAVRYPSCHCLITLGANLIP